MMRRHHLVGAMLLACAVVARAASSYVPQGECAGFPKVDVQVPGGYCMALVADATRGLKFPRRLLEVAPGRYWLIDMGNWEPRQGRLLEMLFKPGAPTPAERVRISVLAQGLDRPLGLAMGPDGKAYVAEAGRIWRTPVAGPLARELVIDHLPDDGAHPLKEIVFASNGRMYINVGSASDACRHDGGSLPRPCPELAGDKPRAAVYEAVLGGPGYTLQSLRPWATGLRNSVALAHVAGADVLLQGENSIDYPAATDPPEELNLLQQGHDYGWPYCVGKRVAARGYEKRFDCSRSDAPHLLWPAHAAPLHMLAVPKDAHNDFAGQLLVAWHGHRATGQRVMGYTLDAKGLPAGAAREWVGGWAAKTGVRPKGAPTGLTIDSAGRLWVVEDRNKTVLMMVREKP